MNTVERKKIRLKRLTEYDREPLIIDTGTTTKRIQRMTLRHPDVWKLTYTSAWTTRNYPIKLRYLW